MSNPKDDPAAPVRTAGGPPKLEIPPLSSAVVEKAARLLRERAAREQQNAPAAADSAPSDPSHPGGVSAAPATGIETAKVPGGAAMIAVGRPARPGHRAAVLTLAIVLVATVAMWAAQRFGTPPSVRAKDAAATPASAAVAPGPTASERSAMAAVAGAPATDDKAEITRLLHDWAQAWSARDTARYFSYYASDFTPPDGMVRARWEQQRKARIATKRRIEVRIANIDVVLMNAQRAMVRFEQSYESDGYVESAKPKSMILARENGSWRIAAEAASR
jgi:ketosteroid isomerase-like protein